MPNFQEKLASKAEKTNEQYREQYRLAMKYISKYFNESWHSNFLADDCTINMDTYGYPEEKLAGDYDVMKKKEAKWISEKEGVNPENVTEEMHQAWLEKQKDVKNKKSDLLEMMTVLLLRKGLSEEYVVVRASKFDDYHGVDNIIVHKPTGTVICAFDDVHDFKFGSNEEKKLKFVKKSAENGGSTIEYGFTFENGEFIKQKIENVPKLYMGFDPIELGKALEEINTNNLDSLESHEIKYFDKMILALEEQIPLLKKHGQKNKKFTQNLNKFAQLLPLMKRSHHVEKEGSMSLAA